MQITNRTWLGTKGEQSPLQEKGFTVEREGHSGWEMGRGAAGCGVGCTEAPPSLL